MSSLPRRLGDLAHHGDDGRLVGDVQAVGLAAAVDLLGHAGRRLAVEVGDGHMGPRLGQGVGGGPPDAVAARGDERHPPVQPLQRQIVHQRPRPPPLAGPQS